MAFPPNYLLFISCFMFLCVWVAAISHHPHSPPPPPPPDSYVIVAMQWPMALCRNRSKCHPGITVPEEFRIHGVWPHNGSTDASMINCLSQDDRMKYSYEDVKDIKQIKSLWPSFQNYNDNEFWEWEWKQHGSCLDKPVTEYFDASVKLFSKKYKLVLDALKRQGLRPHHDGDRHTVERFQNAISNELNLKVTVHCKGEYLVEIRLCAKFDLTEYRNCTKLDVESGCKGKKARFYTSVTTRSTPGVSAY